MKKKKIFRIFVQSYNLCIVWNWFIAKKLFKSHKNNSFEAIQNGGISNLVLQVLSNFGDKCKPCKIYKKNVWCLWRSTF